MASAVIVTSKENVPWNKGIPWSEEFKKKSSESRKGKPNPKARGLKRTPEQIKRISDGHKGQVAWNKKDKIVLACEVCGKRIERVESAVRKHNYCSKKCFISAYSNKKTVDCVWCGKKITRKAYAIDNSEKHFCDRECERLWQKENPPDTFVKFQKGCSPWNKGLKGLHHSPATEFKKGQGSRGIPFKPKDERLMGENNPNWKGGYAPYYGPDWYYQRKLARKRDNHLCQLCGIKENGRKHDVHHIISRRDFDDYKEANKLENLITLCISCHRKVGHHPELLGEI